MASVSLMDVRKAFGTVPVIHNLRLDIREGELIVFVGPSGCGKSTLLRMIAGLEEVSAGTIQIGRRDVTMVDPGKRGIAMVFQSYALYPHMSVEQNMGFGLKMSGVRREEIRAKVAAAAGILKLDQLLTRKPRQLSGGQRQRVAIGRAIVREPEVFLFDEPLSNLDAELRVQMRLEIAKLHQDLGATMIYVTHDQVEAMTLADRIVVLRDGQIEQIGTPEEVYSDPDSLFVAGFIGSPKMNFLPARIIATHGNEANVAVPALGIDSIPVPVRSGNIAGGADCVFGFRPEHTQLAADRPPNARVGIVERLGGSIHLHADLKDGNTVTIELRDGEVPASGTSVTVLPEARRSFLFAGAGARL